MADEGTFTKSADIIVRCGTFAATASAVGQTDKFVQDVEAYICDETRYDWVTNYGTLGTKTKLILKEVGACICAMYAISVSLSEFSGRNGETLLDFLHYRALKGMDVLRETASRKFIGGE